MKLNTNYWIRFSLLNLLIVAALGVIMRYKIGFDFPYLSQKNIQQAHSNFAFLGWISQSLYVAMVHFVSVKLREADLQRYKYLLTGNLICSYGMLISFFAQGYSPLSTGLSVAAIINNILFAYFLLKDFKAMSDKPDALPWFRAALWFNLFSSLGTFYLAYMMATKNFNEHWYLASVYFYLHFQYNGFFSFACLGLAVDQLPQFIPNYKQNKWVFPLFFSACIPAYFLSTLWANLPVWLYVIVVVAAAAQFLAWIIFVISIRKQIKTNSLQLSSFAKFMVIFVAMAFTVKLTLQLGSTVPYVSKLAFGFRSVVIAYLHLVLLAVISGFILAYFYATQLIRNNKRTMTALALFLGGIFLNEVVLAIQGIASFSYIPIKYVNEMLFVISVLLIISALMIFLSQLQHLHLNRIGILRGNDELFGSELKHVHTKEEH